MATISIRVALEPILVMEGAMKPMTIRGTQNMMSWLRTYFRVTTMVITFSGRNRPRIMPAAMPINSFKGRLMPFFSVAIKIILSFCVDTHFISAPQSRSLLQHTRGEACAYVSGPENRRRYALGGWPVMMRIISLSVSRMPRRPRRPMLAMVFSTPLDTMPSPP